MPQLWFLPRFGRIAAPLGAVALATFAFANDGLNWNSAPETVAVPRASIVSEPGVEVDDQSSTENLETTGSAPADVRTIFGPTPYFAPQRPQSAPPLQKPQAIDIEVANGAETAGLEPARQPDEIVGMGLPSVLENQVTDPFISQIVAQRAALLAEANQSADLPSSVDQPAGTASDEPEVEQVTTAAVTSQSLISFTPPIPQPPIDRSRLVPSVAPIRVVASSTPSSHVVVADPDVRIVGQVPNAQPPAQPYAQPDVPAPLALNSGEWPRRLDLVNEKLGIAQAQKFVVYPIRPATFVGQSFVAFSNGLTVRLVPQVNVAN